MNYTETEVKPVMTEETNEMLRSLEWGKRRVLERYWRSVNEDLPEVDEEVIVLNTYGVISFGHIVRRGLVDHDGWNIPGVEFWMPFVPSGAMKAFYQWDGKQWGV